MFRCAAARPRTSSRARSPTTWRRSPRARAATPRSSTTRASSAPTCASCAARTSSGSTREPIGSAVLRHMLAHLLRSAATCSGRTSTSDALDPRRWSARAADAARRPRRRPTSTPSSRASVGLYVRTDLGVDVLCERAPTSCAPSSASRRSPRRSPSACASSPGGRASGSTWTPTRSRRRRASTSAPSTSTKGCYVGPGDGRPPPLQGQAEPPPARPAPVASRPSGGAEILLGERVVGRIGSTCVSPRLGPIALALVRREAAPGDTVLVDGARGAGGRAALRAWLSRAPRPAVTACRARARCSGYGPRRGRAPRYDARAGTLDLPRRAPPTSRRPARPARADPAADPERQLDDWGRSERVFDAASSRVLNFYYRYWFRVEVEGVENVPADGGALLVSNHSGALPPDAPMIMQAIRHEHPSPRPLYMLGEHWFKGYPGRRHARPTRSAWSPPTRPTPSGCCTTRAAWRSSSPRARRARASSTGSATGCAASAAAASCAPRSRAGVPIVPVAVVGRRGGDADLRPRAAAPAPDRADLLPGQPRLPPLRPGRGADVPAREVQDPLPRAGRPVRATAPTTPTTWRSSRGSPRTSARASRRSSTR